MRESKGYALFGNYFVSVKLFPKALPIWLNTDSFEVVCLDMSQNFRPLFKV